MSLTFSIHNRAIRPYADAQTACAAVPRLNPIVRKFKAGRDRRLLCERRPGRVAEDALVVVEPGVAQRAGADMIEPEAVQPLVLQDCCVGIVASDVDVAFPPVEVNHGASLRQRADEFHRQRHEAVAMPQDLSTIDVMLDHAQLGPGGIGRCMPIDRHHAGASAEREPKERREARARW